MEEQVHVMRIMTPLHGDEEVTWKESDKKSVEAARKKFDDAIKAGRIAYKMVKETVVKKGEQIKEFDPSLPGIILAAPLAGG